MAVTLAQLKRNEKTVSVVYGGETINLTYRPSAITPTFGQEEDKEFLVHTLLKLLTKWDIYEDDAQTVMTPVTQEVLDGDALGLPLLRLMFAAVLDDALVGKVNGAT